LFVPRRRVFVRVRRADGGPDGEPDGDRADSAGATGRTLVEVGALARGEDTGLDDELQRLLDRLDPAGTPPTRRDA
jgi:cytochrome c biogenesis protein